MDTQTPDEILKPFIKNCNNTNTIFDTREYVTLEGAKLAMETYASQSKWISVEESKRLPEKGASVIVCGIDKEIESAYFDNDGRFWNLYTDDDLTGQITHWHPFPSPPKPTTMTPTLNYYHSRGITPARCVCQCQELGLNPANWSHLSTAFEILKTKYALRNY